MTAEEFILYLNKIYGLGKWPKTRFVEHETYANCCQYIFEQLAEIHSEQTIYLSLGPHNGLMFKGIELLLMK